MMQPPAEPKIYHITHVDNLKGIVMEGGLLSDARVAQRGDPIQPVGMSEIKRRRLYKIEVPCHPGTKVGEYVPFYFCPRSVMLYVIYRANLPELTYRGGQDPIIHLEADLYQVVEWANANNVHWAFSRSNAGAYYTEFYFDLRDLDKLDWQAIQATDFRDPDIKEGKQAEFLFYDFFPFELVERIGVRTAKIEAKVRQMLGDAFHLPIVEVKSEWYF
jgi:hypothetical protein